MAVFLDELIGLTVREVGTANCWPVASAEASIVSVLPDPTMKYFGLVKCKAAILPGSRVNVAENKSF
jgi:hypothetical protein